MTTSEPTTREILDQFKPEIERAREKYKRITNATTKELVIELCELMQIFDEVFSRIGLERFNDTSTLVKVAADRLESQQLEIERLKAEMLVNAMECAERIANMTAERDAEKARADAAVAENERLLNYERVKTRTTNTFACFRRCESEKV